MPAAGFGGGAGRTARGVTTSAESEMTVESHARGAVEPANAAARLLAGRREDSGVFCDDGVCAALRDEGESCALRYGGCDAQTCSSPDPTACRPGLLCSTRDGRPTCVAPQPNGAACTSFVECSSHWCEMPSCSGDGCSAVGVCRDPKRTLPTVADEAR